MINEENRTLSDKFMLRLPDGMREKIKAAADEAGRSMNAEIVHRLDASFRADWSGVPDSMTHRIAQFEEYMRSQFLELRSELQAERLARAKAEDSLLRERLKEAEPGPDSLTPSGPDFLP